MSRLGRVVRSVSVRVSSFTSFGKDHLWAEFLTERVPIFWIIGASQSGKSTMGHFLSECSNYRLISTKNLFNIQGKLDKKPNTNVMIKMLKEELKTTFRFCQGYIFDDFPDNYKDYRKFKKKIRRPSVIIFITIGLDGIIGRTLAQHPNADLNTTRVSYVVQSKFAEKLYRRYHRLNSAIKLFSQSPIQDTHAKLLEYLEADFGYKFRPTASKQ